MNIIEEKADHQSYTLVNPVSYNNVFPSKIFPLAQKWHYFLIGLKDKFMRNNPYGVPLTAKNLGQNMSQALGESLPNYLGKTP